MEITRQADYALRAMLFLARLGPDQHAATSLIANDRKIPLSFLAKIISQLSIAGLIHTSRGAHGGVSIAKSPREISLLEVVEAIDGPISLNECVVNPKTCDSNGDCPLRQVWCDTQQALVQKLRSTSFDEVTSMKQ
jgi:Rrf2 family iron-sulfur cluster assembly transcriptional regulator